MLFKTFDNGLVLLYEKNKVSKNDSFHINVLTGSALETKNELGLNHLVEHLMFKSSYKRTTKQIAGELEEQGALVNAWTNYDNVCFHFTCLPDKLDKCAEIYADMLFNKNIKQDEFEREKSVVCQEIKMYEDDFVATNETNYFDYFWNMKDVAGTTESVMGFKLKKVNDFISRHYVPCNMVISVCSHLSFKKICKIVDNYFGIQQNPSDYVFLRDEWKNRKVFKRNHFGEIYKQKKKTAQVQTLHAFYLPNINRTLISYYENILSDGLSAILFNEVREKYGLCYSIHAEAVTLYPEVFNRNRCNILFIKSSTEKKYLNKYLEVLPQVISNLPKLLKDSDIERAINIQKTLDLKASDIAMYNFFKYLNPNIDYSLGKTLKDEWKYIYKNRKKLAIEGMDILKCLRYDVAILGNI